MKNRFQTRIIRICIVKMIRIPAWTIGPTFSVQTFAFVKCTVKQLYWNCLLILLLLILSIFSMSTANVSFYLLSCVYRSLATLSYILFMYLVLYFKLTLPSICGKFSQTLILGPAIPPLVLFMCSMEILESVARPLYKPKSRGKLTTFSLFSWSMFTVLYAHLVCSCSRTGPVAKAASPHCKNIK